MPRVFRIIVLAVCVAIGAGSSVWSQSPSDTERMMRPLEKENVGPPRPPELVVTRGWASKKFGRLVFDWRNPVKFKAKVVGEQLKITFDRPLKTKFDKVSKSLEAYLSDLHIHSKDKVISARLRGYYSVRSFSNENAVVVDLIPENQPTGEQEEDAEAWRKRLPIIPVRAGKHPGFGRLVFDWRNEAGYDVERQGDIIRVRFDRPARIDVSRVSTALPGRISAATTETTKLATRVGLIIPKDAEFRHFRDGTKVAFDIIAPEPPPVKNSAAQPAATETADQKKARESQKAFASKKDAKKAKNAPLSLTKKQRRLRRMAERKRRLNERKFKGAPLVTVEARRRGSALDLKFNWRKKVSAAVYRRGEYLWVLFDDRARFSVDTIEVVGEGFIENVEQTDASEKSVLRIKAPEHLLATVTKPGNAWTIRLAPARMTSPLATPIQIHTEKDSDKNPAMLVAAKGITRPFIYVDGMVGDYVHVYAVPTPGVGNRVARNLIGMEIPSSGAGLVLVPRRDDLSFLRNAKGIYVSAPGGLNITKAIKAIPVAGVEESGHIFGALTTWGQVGGKDFEDSKHKLMRRILVAPKNQRNDARMDLARFYIANGMAADAMGIIELLQKQSPDLANDVKLRALRAAAHLLLGHYVSAQSDFDHSHLKNDPSVAPWLAVIAAAKGDWQKAHQLIRDTRGMVSSFPLQMKIRFHLIGAEAALAVSDIDAAKPWIDALRSAPMSVAQSGYLKFLEGHALNLSGKLTAARGVWRSLLTSEDRRVRAKANFALINSELETKRITPKKAIERLESLSFAWRGDSFEFDLKRRLGDIHAQKGEYRASLLRLRQAASHFKDVQGAGAIAEDMRQWFKKLFLEGGADKMKPVAALALYEEFRELTPAGKEGDEMIRKLADRLTNVDLLSEAGRLLQHQVKFRLTGVERSRVGARLALIRLLNREPAKAVEGLKLSIADEMPSELEVQRRYLMARALGEQKKTKEALEVLAGDVNHEAEILRLGLHWDNADWSEVSRTVRRIIPQSSVASLSPKYADMVLRWAVALTMEGDADGLRSLRDRFGSAMAQTKYKEAFAAVAGEEAGELPDFKALVKKTGDLKDFRSFLASYREKVRNNALSAIN